MQWKIGNVKIPNQVIVAPMAGVTNVAFRSICKKFGAGLVVCEMISDKGIHFKNKKTLNMLFVDKKEHPVSIQIFGGSIDSLVEAAYFVSQNTTADIIDINMGCPVPKVTKTDAGSHWLLDPDKIYKVVKSITKVVDKPVSVKMRTGWDDDHIFAVENALAAEEGGASMVAMHGRTRKQLYEGHANWNILKDVADHLTKIPFVGNGDIHNAEDAKIMLDQVGVDAVMIGRAVLGNPWIISQIINYLDTGKLLNEPSPFEKIKIAKDHLHELVRTKGEVVGPREFRSQAAYYIKGIPRAAKTKVALNSATTEEEMTNIFDEFLSKINSKI